MLGHLKASSLIIMYILHISCSFNFSDFSNHYYDNLIKVRNSTFECPILKTSIIWDGFSVTNPTVIKKDGIFFLYFVAKDKSYKNEAGTSRIAVTWSKNISDFRSTDRLPVLFPSVDNNIRCETFK